MEGLSRGPAQPAGSPEARRPWYVDWLWVGYLVWVLPHFAVTYGPRALQWLRGHHPG